ncbi:MAG: Nif3-like dinuclear metal center hexameric protein [Clostridia bacterium]|nr:Nif3-like dinuclear metal center hexameric protein [Clostridia bacterium]
MDRRAFYEIFNRAYPPELSCEWDNDGVMVCGDLRREVKRVLVCLDATSQCVEEAVNEDFDLIVSHHPLLFRGLKTLDASNPVGKKLFALTKNDVAVFSFHTRMDAAPSGLNRSVADALGFLDPKPLSVPGVQGSIALIGNVKESSPEEFAALSAARFSSPVTLWSANKKITKAVCVCGGGRDLLSAACACGADLVISGDLGYNGVLDAVESGMSVLELPHRASELLCLNVFEDLIASNAPDVYVKKCSSGGESMVFMP